MLTVRGLSKSFQSGGTTHEVIRELDFTVQDRAFFMVLGQSGCGKSTLLRMLGGFLAPDGEIGRASCRERVCLYV